MIRIVGGLLAARDIVHAAVARRCSIGRADCNFGSKTARDRESSFASCFGMYSNEKYQHLCYYVYNLKPLVKICDYRRVYLMAVQLLLFWWNKKGEIITQTLPEERRWP